MIINEKILKMKEKINIKPKISITYFVPDIRKQGGKYVTITGNIKKIDEFKHLIIFEDKKEIPIQEIIEIVDIEEMPKL